MSRLRSTTLVCAFAIGAIGAVYAWPRWRDAHAAGRAMHVEADVRARAWAHLGRTDASRRRAAVSLAPALERAPDDALLDASDQLRPFGLWSWRDQEPAVIFRELRLRLERNPEDAPDLIAAMLWTVPFDVDAGALMSLVADAPAAFEAALAWAGPEPSRIDLIPRLESTERMRLLALASVDPFAVPPLPDPIAPSPTIDAQLLAHVLRAPADGAPIRRAADVIPVDLFRAWSTDPRERVRLGEPAQTAADPERRRAALAHIANRAPFPIQRRRRALWELDAGMAGRDLVRELLAAPVADERGDVALTALIAERHLSADDASDLAQRWIGSFDDDEKRAGAVLAALTGAHRADVARALTTEDIPAVRTVYRLALWDDGAPDADIDPRELAYRALRRDDGALNLDAVVLGLAAGDLEFVRILTSRQGDGDLFRCAERFLPDWPPVIHRPVTTKADDLRFSFDWLRATWAVHARRLRFDAPTRTFVPTPTTNLPPGGNRPKMKP